MNDRVVVGGLHRVFDRLLGVRGNSIMDLPEKHAIAAQFPADDVSRQLAAAVAEAEGGLRGLSIPEELFVELGFGNFVKIPFFDLMNREDAFWVLASLVITFS